MGRSLCRTVTVHALVAALLAGGTAAAAILFIIFNALAGLGLVVVKALGGETFAAPGRPAESASARSRPRITGTCNAFK